MPLALAAVIIGLYVWASTRSAPVTATGDHTVTKAPSSVPPLSGGTAMVSSSPLTDTQKVIATIPSDLGPVPVVADSLTTGNILNIAQVWRAGVSHFVATYRDGSQVEVDATGKQIGPWNG